MTVFDHLAIGRTAMRAFRIGMNVSGYNVANAATEGFSRRRVELGAMPTIEIRNGIIGMGVDVSGVHRVRDPFLDFAARREGARLGADSARQEILSAIEPALGEAEKTALSNSLTAFFDAFESLSTQPDNVASRANVLASAEALANSFHTTRRQFDESRRAADVRINEKIDRVNEILDHLQSMNVDMIAQEAGGAEASDLRDQRDQLLDELSGLIGVRTVEQENGQVSVFLEGTGDTLLATVSVRHLEKTVDATGLTHVVVNRGGELTDISATLRSGELGGYLKSRDEDVIGYRDMLDTLAASVITEVNAIHTTGFDLDGQAGLALFIPDPPGTDAAGSIAVNTAVSADVRRIAASSVAGASGNNEIANRLAKLRDTVLAGLGGRSLGEYGADIVAEVGRDVDTANVARDAGQAVVDSIESRRSQMSGVSLDEEAADLVRWQQSFQAAARFLQTANQVISDTLDMLSR